MDYVYVTADTIIQNYFSHHYYNYVYMNKTIRLKQKGDVIGSFRNPEETGEELVPLDKEVVASIFGKIRKDPKEPERGQTHSIDPKQAKELEARLQIHATV
jgi:hypothetical protein